VLLMSLDEVVYPLRRVGTTTKAGPVPATIIFLHPSALNKSFDEVAYHHYFFLIRPTSLASPFSRCALC
jgi:hypothetical protein